MDSNWVSKARIAMTRNASSARLKPNLVRKRISSMSRTNMGLLLAPLVLLSGLAVLSHFLMHTSWHGRYLQLQSSWGQSVECDWNGNPFLKMDSMFSSPRRAQQQYLLAITLGWGEFDFATAKGIDVVWDWVVGRGWQVIATWLLYVTFRRFWVIDFDRSERAGNVLPASAALALQYYTASFAALWTYVRLLIRRQRRTWAGHVGMAVLVLDVIYVLLAPTWISTMTGYAAINSTVIKVDDSTFVGVAQTTRCQHIVVDGARVGLANNTCLSSMPNDLHECE